MNTIPPNVKNDARHDDPRNAGISDDKKTQIPEDKKGQKDTSSEEDMDNVVSQRSNEK